MRHGDSQNVNEYAFALGALAHHAGDNLGHPIAVNRAVPIVYPKVGAKLGPEVLFADSPSRHVMVEFAFDVVEVARGTFKSDLYQNLGGFEVAMPVLARAFRETYGLELRDVFGDTDLAVGTYRYAVSKIIPDMTRLALFRIARAVSRGAARRTRGRDRPVRAGRLTDYARLSAVACS